MKTEGEALGHTIQTATCTTPAYCSVCHVSSGEANGHTWDAIGFTCTICGAPSNCVFEENFSLSLNSDWFSPGNAFYVDTETGVLTLDPNKTSDISLIGCTPEGWDQWVDYDVNVKMSAPASTGCWNGILFRASADLSSYYYFRFLNGRYQIGSHKGQIAISNGSKALDGLIHDISISVKGSSIIVRVDGTEIFNVTDTTIAQGGVGFYSQYTVAKYDDLTVYNTGDPITVMTDVVVNVVFKDGNNLDGKRPASVSMKLFADGVYAGKTTVLKESSNWQKIYTMPKYNEMGEEIYYSVEATAIADGYTLVTEGTTITLSHRAETLVMSEFFDSEYSDGLNWKTQFDQTDSTGHKIGYWDVSNDRLQMHYTATNGSMSGTSAYYNRNLADWRDFTMKASVYFGENDGNTRWIRIAFRTNPVKDNTTGYSFAFLNKDDKTYISLLRDQTQIGEQVVLDYSLYGEQTVTITAVGNSISLGLGRYTYQFTDDMAEIYSGTIGFRATKYDAYVDNIEVTDLNAYSLVAEGNCGSNLTWKLDDGGKLVISGSGAMTGCAVAEDAPWYSYKDQIKTVVLEEGVSSVETGAFYGYGKLHTIIIPQSMKQIAPFAFAGCSALKSVHISDVGAWAMIDFGSVESNPLYFAEDLYLNLEMLSGELVLPLNVTHIGDYAFNNCIYLNSVVLHDGITSIGTGAFYNCTSLRSITLNEGLVEIGSSAFNNCSSLAAIDLPNTLESIGSNAFYNCVSLEGITIPANTGFIGVTAFYNCGALQYIRVDEANPTYCNDSYGVLFDKGMTLLIQAPGKLSGSYAVPEGIKRIHMNAFAGCVDLEQVTLPEGIVRIGNNAFYDCVGLEKINLPQSIAEIGNYAFYNCLRLSTVELPVALTQLGAFAF